MNNVLITGGSGYVGCNLVRHLAESGWNIHVLLRPSSDLSVLPHTDNIIIHQVSLDSQNLTKILKHNKIQCVIHLATLYAHETETDKISDVINANVLLGSLLLQAMKKAGCRRFINTASNAEFNQAGEVDPNSFYAASKAAFRQILSYYEKCHQFSVINLVMYDNYGSNDPRPKLINLLMLQKKADQSLKMSPGDQQINLVHISDTVRALTKALNYLIVVNSVDASWSLCCAAADESISLKELVRVFNSVQQCNLDIQWNALPYRDNEIMQPWVGTIVPGWRTEVALYDGLALMS